MTHPLKQPTRAQLDPRPAAKPTAAELTRRLSVADEENAALARSLGALRESDRARRELLRCALVALESVPDPGARDLELQAQIRANVARAADGYPPSRAVVAPDAASGKLSSPRATPGAPGTESASQSPSRASNRHRPNPASRGCRCGSATR